MKEAPIPANEAERMIALAKLNILDTPPEERFDRITRLALYIFRVPISTLTLVDSDREWFKSCQGLPEKEGKRAISFCGHAMLSEGPFVIPDTTKDPRFADNPMVIGPPYIRFYAGVPIKSVDGQRVGVFCIKDRIPRKLTKKQIEVLKSLGSWAEWELNFHELGLLPESRPDVENKIMDANKVLKLLNVIMRHDILNDLTIIKNSLHMMAETKDEKYFKDCLAIIERSIFLVEKMRDLESSILVGAKLKPYQMGDIVRKVSAGYPGIDFAVKGDCTILADEAIYSVVENIVNNAKTHGEAKHIDITMENVGDRAEVTIANDGKSMPEQAKERLLKEGVALSETTGRTGLGLYIVKKTVERYHGSVRIEDNKPTGTRLIFSFPRIA